MEQEQYEYEGSPIQAWDLAHGIVTVCKNGCEYRVCRDWQRFNDICDAEKREALQRTIAEQQAAAYLKEG